jgi:lipoprotein-anchoring transpeptidase ErfK/SrfK
LFVWSLHEICCRPSWNLPGSSTIDATENGISAREYVMSANTRPRDFCAAFLFAGALMLPAASASAQTLTSMSAPRYEPASPQYVPQDDQSDGVVADELAAPLRRQVVAYPTGEPAGTIIIDTPHTYLYLTLGDGNALRYGIGVGREGFTWSGVETIVRKAEWPDWIPPAEMVARQPYLPRWVGGGPGNPLGARALYLGNTDYRIHGTNDPTTIGKHVSSGCIRLQNADVIDLFNRVGLGTRVMVLPNDERRAALDNGARVAINDGRGGPMTATIAVTPAAMQSTAPGGSALRGVY